MKHISMIAVLTLAACASPAPAPSQIERVVSTTSFGMCAGYCITRLEISDGQAVLIRQSGGRGGPNAARPDQRFTTPLNAAEWQEIQSLAARSDLTVLPDVVGCPDCADGGAEGLIIEGSNGAERVSFEFGADLTPAQPLLNRVRELRTRLTPIE